MHHRILIMFYCLSTYAYSQSSIELKKEDPQSSRCEGNGRSELTPYLSKLKSKKFKDIRLSRTKERAYSLIEKARLIKNNQEFTYTQAGCDHMSEGVSFVTKDAQALSHLQAHFSNILLVLDAIEVKEMQEAVKKLMRGLNTKNSPNTIKEEQCDVVTDTKVYCTVAVQANYSFIEILLEKQQDLITHTVSLQTRL